MPQTHDLTFEEGEEFSEPVFINQGPCGLVWPATFDGTGVTVQWAPGLRDDTPGSNEWLDAAEADTDAVTITKAEGKRSVIIPTVFEGWGWLRLKASEAQGEVRTVRLVFPLRATR